MKIAPRFSAGWEPGTINKSVKRTTERYRSAGFRLSRPLRGLYESLCPRIPPMNRWATVIRRLRRLLQQSPGGALRAELPTLNKKSKVLLRQSHFHTLRVQG